MKKENQRWSAGISLPQTSTSDLRGKQSVRATFKLTEECIDAINIVATHLGIKQKSLFDHLVEDIDSLMSIARGIQNARLVKHSRFQKTYVLSRKSLYSLDKASKSYNAPRDALVEYSVRRLLPVIAQEQKKHEKRKKMLAVIERHFNEGRKLIGKLEAELGQDDPIFHKFVSAMTYYDSVYSFIDSFVEKGKIIEDFDPDLMRRILMSSEE